MNSLLCVPATNPIRDDYPSVDFSGSSSTFPSYPLFACMTVVSVRAVKMCHQPLPSTKAEWQQLVLQKAGIDPNTWNTNNGLNHVNRRNIAKVFQYYRDLYRQNPSKFLWAGLATLAGHQILRGLSLTRGTRQVITLHGNMYHKPEGFIERMALLGKVILPVADDLFLLEQTLVGINKAIFEDLGWQHLAYLEGGIKALEYCYRNGEITEKNYQAWVNIEKGNVEEGTNALVRIEHEDIAQKGFDTIKDNGPLTSLISISAREIASTGTSFLTAIPSGNLADLGHRLEWINGELEILYNLKRRGLQIFPL